MTTLHASSLPRVQETVRPLSAYEHLFWAVDKINGFNFSIVVTLRGRVARDAWRAAFAEVQKRHPFLDVCVNQDDELAPYFIRGEGLPIPLAFEPRRTRTHWQRTMEREVAEPFDQSAAPLLRAVVLEDEEGCDLILTANHIVIDGMGVVALAGDLLAALAGEKLLALPAPASAEERAARVRAANPLPVPQTEQATAGNGDETLAARTFACRKGGGTPRIAALRLTAEQTARLQRSCREQRTTIGAVLLAALATALRRLSPVLQETGLRVATPVDARPYLGNENDFVLSIVSARADSPYPDMELWASARGLKAQVAPFQSFAEIEATFRRVEAVLEQQFDAETLVQMLIGKFGHDLLLSNLKNVEFAHAPGGIAVEAVWGPSVLLGVEGEQVVGSATFGGALHLVYSSYTPVEGLLETVEAMLVEAAV